MSRAARTLGALVVMVCCLAAAVVAPGYAGPGHARDAREARQPVAPVRLPVSIEVLNPSTLTPGRPVTVSGTVYNNTDGVWGDAQVGMLVSSEPFTTGSELAAATRADPYEDFVGEQVLEPGTFDDIGDIAPGQTRSFTFTVPYAEMELSGSEGAYWVGAELRVTGADGLRGSVARTLTFMPLVENPARAPVVDLAMLWPITAPVPWDGSAFVNSSLNAQFAPTGRLRTLAELGATAGGTRLTWVLDPAVLDAARKMADGFRRAGAAPVGPRDRQAVDAAEWLEVVTDAVGGGLALSVPYGHPDVAALAHAGVRPGLAKAQRAGAKVLDEMRIAHLGMMWPGNGLADRDVLRSSTQFDPEVALLSRPTSPTSRRAPPSDCARRPTARAVVRATARAAAPRAGRTTAPPTTPRPRPSRGNGTRWWSTATAAGTGCAPSPAGRRCSGGS
ncbi:MAG: DUF6049 family protein [Actinomycetota bacterium]|nr:DUF6049 family protein [Actinomycetota bacterium]